MSEHGLPGKEVKRVQQRLDFQRFSGKRRLNGDLLLLLSRPTASAPGLETAQGQKGKRSGGVVPVLFAPWKACTAPGVRRKSRTSSRTQKLSSSGLFGH